MVAVRQPDGGSDGQGGRVDHSECVVALDGHQDSIAARVVDDVADLRAQVNCASNLPAVCIDDGFGAAGLVGCPDRASPPVVGQSVGVFAG